MDRDQLHNRIIRELIARIASGIYRRGQRLPAERVLCEEFEVARGTLRRALGLLQDMDVVAIRRGSGAYVRGIRPSRLPQNVLPADVASVNLLDVLQARKAIETAAVRLAATRMTTRELNELRGLVEQMGEATHEMPRFIELDMAFHHAIVRAGGNPVLVTAFNAIHEYHRFSQVFTSQHEGGEEEALEYHRRLLCALEKKDARRSAQVLSRHLDSMEKYQRRRARPILGQPSGVMKRRTAVSQGRSNGHSGIPARTAVR